MKEENKDIRNRSMRSTFIFRRLLESEQSEAQKDVSKNLSKLLAHRLVLDHYEFDLRLNRAQRTPQSDFAKRCRLIYTQFVNWSCEDNIRRLIAIDASNKSKTAVTQMFPKALTKRWNNFLIRR